MKAQAHIEDAHAGQTPDQVSSPTADEVALRLHELDLVASFVASVGVVLLVLISVVVGLIEAVKWLASHWANPAERSVVLIAGCAVFWVLVRWEKTRRN